MRDSLTRRRFATVTTASMAGVVSLSGCLGDDGGGPPDVSFSVAADVENSEITVTHDDGEMLVAENTAAIQIRLDAGNNENSLLLGEWKPPVEKGDSTTVEGDIKQGNTAIVRWISPDETEFKDVTTQQLG
jgi:hypothetical protein